MSVINCIFQLLLVYYAILRYCDVIGSFGWSHSIDWHHIPICVVFMGPKGDRSGRKSRPKFNLAAILNLC